MILVAGCTTQAPPTPENGLVITEFYAEPTVVEEGEPVTFFLEVENKGDVTAEYVTAQLYGVEGMWYVDPTTVDAVTLKNIFECWITGAIAGTFRWDAFSWSFFIGNQACLRLLSQHPLVKWGTLRLEPPKPEQGKSYGDFELTQWRLYPPDLPEGVRQEFPITVHVTYAYKSNAVVNIMALNEREAKRMTQRGESISNPITVSNTKGPIQIRVERADAPIIVENPYFRPFGQEFNPNLINTFHTYNPYNPFFYTDTVTFFSEDSYTFDERMFYYTIFNNLFFFSFWERVGWSIDYYEDFVQKTTLKIKLENVGSGSPIFPSYRDAHGNVIEGAVFGIIRLEAPRGPGGVPTAWFENCLGTPYGNV
ncbi:MAG TPA: hypothetical protein EYP23_01345, partial [Thermoplasmata archaeon]|nr:hypothetical protein [Thermoplasmata archaeon]